MKMTLEKMLHTLKTVMGTKAVIESVLRECETEEEQMDVLAVFFIASYIRMRDKFGARPANALVSQLQDKVKEAEASTTH